MSRCGDQTGFLCVSSQPFSHRVPVEGHIFNYLNFPHMISFLSNYEMPILDVLLPCCAVQERLCSQIIPTVADREGQRRCLISPAGCAACDITFSQPCIPLTLLTVAYHFSTAAHTIRYVLTKERVSVVLQLIRRGRCIRSYEVDGA